MASANLYIRVSTDEQAQKGYSQRSQEEKLGKYCEERHIDILERVFEDHSAKDFDRPAWSRMMASLNARKAPKPDFILFTRWDRFSRNTANAYYMITLLKKMGIELQAIDQPLDLLVPENKVMLAMYIVTAEVENDRRSLNVRQGMQRAKREGRWMGLAPIGYINVSMPDGTKAIVPRQPEALLVAKAFEKLPEASSVRALYREMVKMGLSYSISAFFGMLQNPVYCGRIRIGDANGWHATEVPGTHQPLVSEELFSLVQKRLRHPNTKYVPQAANPILMLRGMIYCPVCSKRLTGSGSKGHAKRYFYYHCTPPCQYRTRADILNGLFLSQIEKLRPRREYVDIFSRLLKDARQERNLQASLDREGISRALLKLIGRVANARELLIKGIIDEEDYSSIKADCESRITMLGEQLDRAYLSDIQKEQEYRRALSFFMHPELLFNRGTGISSKAVALFVLQGFSPFEGFGDECIAYEARVVFGLPRQLNKADNLKEETISKFFCMERKSAFIEKIVNIEKHHHCKCSLTDANKVFDFLAVLSQICISIRSATG